MTNLLATSECLIIWEKGQTLHKEQVSDEEMHMVSDSNRQRPFDVVNSALSCN